jgi:predicted RNA-binding Zn-ribbon protein involved in translation (DUF1610 family)
MKPFIKKCDECASDYYADQSQMAHICPECSHLLYGYPNCDHVFKDNRCIKCYWDGKTSAYIQNLK